MEDIVQECIRVVINKTGKRSVSNTMVQKLLFVIRGKLSDSNELKSKLAYYWYQHGPYSDIINKNMQMLVDKNILERKQDGFYTKTHKTAMSIAPLNSKTREIINSVTREFTHTNKLTHEIYQNAPFDWYRTLHDEFMTAFGQFSNNRHTPDYIINLLDNVALSGPDYPHCMKSKQLMMGLAQILNAVLRNETIPYDKMPKLYQLCEEIWKCFAMDAKIEHHDSYYDNQISDWKQQRDNMIEETFVKLHECEKEFASYEYSLDLPSEIKNLLRHPENIKTVPFVL